MVYGTIAEIFQSTETLGLLAFHDVILLNDLFLLISKAYYAKISKYIL